MSVVNLLPRHRRAKLRTQRHLRLWAGSLGVYTAILSAAVAGAAIFAPPHATSIEQRRRPHRTTDHSTRGGTRPSPVGRTRHRNRPQARRSRRQTAD